MAKGGILLMAEIGILYLTIYTVVRMELSWTAKGVLAFLQFVDSADTLIDIIEICIRNRCRNKTS